MLPAGHGTAGAGCRCPRPRPDCGFPADGQAFARRGSLESRRFAGRSGRRHRLHRAALAQERHRRRRDGDDLLGAQSVFGCGARLCRLCDRERPRELQRGRKPDATADGRARGRVGGAGRGHSRLPADDGSHQVLPAPGGGRAVWPDAWAAARRSACTPRAVRPTRRPISAWSRLGWA